MLFPLQVCSAVHNQDFTLVDDYITGLKTLLYLQGVSELAQWDGQSPPTPKHQRGKIITPKLKEVIGKVKNWVSVAFSYKTCPLLSYRFPYVKRMLLILHDCCLPVESASIWTISP